MARTYAKVRIDIWADDDFRQLTDPAQALYFRLMTSPTLSLAGVADWRPVRLAHLTRGMTAQQLNNAASELAEALYVVVDPDTEEILLRSFIRHDGIMKYPNIATSMLKDYAAIFSPTLKGVVVHELRRLHDEEPDMAGWKVIGERLDDRAIDPAELTPFNSSNLVPKQFDVGSGNGSNLVPERFDSGSGNRYPNGSYIPQPSTLNPQPSTPEDKSSGRGVLGGSANAQTTKKRATPIPDGWTPNDGHAKLALEHGVQLLTEASKFRDHAQANGRTLKDWDAGFRNWIRKAGEYKKRDNQPGQYGPTAFAGVTPFGGPDDNPF